MQSEKFCTSGICRELDRLAALWRDASHIALLYTVVTTTAHEIWILTGAHTRLEVIHGTHLWTRAHKKIHNICIHTTPKHTTHKKNTFRKSTNTDASQTINYTRD